MNPKNTILLCSELLGKPTKKEIKKSKILEEKLRKQVQEGKGYAGVPIIMLGLKNAFEKNKEKDGATFLFSEEATPKTQLCTKIITSGFL